MYMLTVLSRSPATGYLIMQEIEEKTEGAWRPGAGTVYPLLKGLVREGLARTGGSKGRTGSRTYVLTPRGKRDLEEIRKTISGMGRKDRVLMNLISEILPGRTYIRMMLNRYREGIETFKEKVGEVSEDERDLALMELRLLVESQIQWIDSQLTHDAKGKRKSGVVLKA